MHDVKLHKHAVEQSEVGCSDTCWSSGLTTVHQKLVNTATNLLHGGQKGKSTALLKKALVPDYDDKSLDDSFKLYSEIKVAGYGHSEDKQINSRLYFQSWSLSAKELKEQ